MQLEHHLKQLQITNSWCLVPTTVLAQHYKTFTDRLNDFPCNIDYINRFKTRKEIIKSIENLKTGRTDILIGTHRLVSDDIKFKDLGLLIIDEEQKFGVSTKEKSEILKKWRYINFFRNTNTKNTTIITMGARDISILKPPSNRNAISTEIIQFDINSISKNTIRNSKRGSNIFIHNRIADTEIHDLLIFNLILKYHLKLNTMTNARNKLEQVILDFINGEFDILLSTTIVGNGVDIPNANTIL